MDGFPSLWTLRRAWFTCTSKEWSTETLKAYVLNNRAYSPFLMETFKANILIDETCNARLADFGLLTIISESTSFSASSTPLTEAGTGRWMGPELLLPEKFGLKHSRATKRSDCYAFGMVVYEVLSGNVPFYRHTRYAVVAKVLDGERPERPGGAGGVWFTDEVWRVLECCWMADPGERSSVPEVLRSLKRWTPPSPQSLILADLVTAKPLIDSNTEEGTDESKPFSPSLSQPLWTLPPQGNG